MEYCSLTINGRILDDDLEGYLTVNVEGRGLLERVISSVEIPGRDGVYVLNQQLPPRYIRVFFMLKALNSRQKNDRLNALHDALKSDGDVQFKFGDEDHHRYGRLLEVEDPPYDQLQGIGSFTFFCQDPYKYKSINTLTGTNIILPSGPVFPYKINSLTLTMDSRTGLTIRNLTTGRKIVLTGAFTAGQILTINEDTILLNGQNAMNRLDFINSDWREFKINPGDTINAPVSMSLSVLERAL